MQLVKSKQIANCCQPNAIMTLAEYLEDYASEKTREDGYKLIEKEIKKIPSDKMREVVEKNLENIKKGQRDFRV